MAVVLLMVWSLPVAAAPPTSSYAVAARAFSRLPISERLKVKVLLTAAGYWPAAADASFSRQFFEATAQYQSDNALPATGAVDEDLRARLFRAGAPLFEMWGFRAIPHPSRGYKIWAPMALGLLAERDKDGLTWRDPAKRVWLTYDYLRDVNLAAAYKSVVDKVIADGGQIVSKVLTEDFFSVSSRSNGLDSFIRCQSDRPGVIWLSLFWLESAADLHLERAATLIAGSLSSSISGAPFVDISQLPSSADLSVGPMATPAPETPQKPRENFSGMGFFVNREGHVVTSAHVVGPCSIIEVAQNGRPGAQAELIAREDATDLALLKTSLKPEGVVNIRSDVRLGEAIEAFAIPLPPVPLNAGGFSFGRITGLSGVAGDDRMLQISTPAQPGDSGGPLFDQSGNVVGVVSAGLGAVKTLVATSGDAPQAANFALKGNLLAGFLDGNHIAFTAALASKEISAPALTAQAQAVSVSVSCR
ncbi:serine protease [Methylocella silvestris]|uniref:serine protease n=1 Tax=Methylocella silvestris TaxID=199596 RepID=UPI0015E0EF68|nr:serine protease [Methylocella silvestris]